MKVNTFHQFWIKNISFFDFFRLIRAGIVICLALLFFCAVGIAGQDRIDALHPLDFPAAAIQKNAEPEVQEPYVSRTGWVELAVDSFFPEAIETGQRKASSMAFKGHGLSISFFSDISFVIEIDSESRPDEDMLLLRGHIQGHEISTFSMTVTRDDYLVRLQDLDTNTVYRVVGDTKTGRGRIVEIDSSMMPPVQHLPPLVPGEEKK